MGKGDVISLKTEESGIFSITGKKKDEVKNSLILQGSFQGRPEKHRVKRD